MTNKEMENEIKKILQIVHDDALQPMHNPQLGYSMKAFDKIISLINISTQSAIRETEKRMINKIQEIQSIITPQAFVNPDVCYDQLANMSVALSELITHSSQK